MLSRFLVLLALYTVGMLVGNLHFRADDVRLTGQHVRTLVAALQVGIVSALLFVHELFMFFIRVVKHERTKFVLVSHVPAPVHLHDVQSTLVDEAELPSKEPQRREPSREPQSERDAERAASEDGRSVRVAIDDTGSVRFDARSEGLSETSDGLNLQIVFERSVNLDLYFLYVTFVGLLLWVTFVSFNFATQDSTLVIVFGLVTGWITNSLSRECHCHESRTELKRGEKLRLIICSVASLLIMTLAFAQWRVPVGDAAALRVYLPAYCSGFFWTACAQEVAFTGMHDCVSRGILHDARRALPTFALVVMVSALSCAPDTIERVFEYIAALSRLAAVHLLLLEPVLIFLCVYVMVIALEKQRGADLAIALVLVEGVHIAYRSQKYDATVITAIAASVLLFAVHAGHLLRA
jgi:hypothetical protein